MVARKGCTAREGGRESAVCTVIDSMTAAVELLCIPPNRLSLAATVEKEMKKVWRPLGGKINYFSVISTRKSVATATAAAAVKRADNWSLRLLQIDCPAISEISLGRNSF